MEPLKMESAYFLTLTIVTLWTVCQPGQTSNTNNFYLREGCICPQSEIRNLTYECTTVGSGVTQWRGSAFDCPRQNNEISLRHSQFQPVSSGSSGECNNGNITGRSLGVEGNRYSSQLFVVYTPDLFGRNIVCVHSVSSAEDVIGNATIGFTTEPFPPPNTITLSKILLGPQLTFNWTRHASNCPSIDYLITSDCGCPTSTAVNRVACASVTVDGRTCSFAVKTRVCGSIEGINSDPLLVKLKVPDVPNVNDVVPTYSLETGQLAAIKINFMETASFVIAGDNDGSASSYTVTYTDSLTGDVCATDTVLPSSCEDGVCRHLFDLSTSNCERSVPINITMTATNILGTGPPSNSVSVLDVHNRVFDVMINLQSSAVICTFLNQEGGAEKSCTVTYYQSESDGCTVEGADVAVQSSLTRQTAQNTSNTVIVGVPFVDSIPIDSQTRYCLVVMASNGSHTANVLGSFNKGCDPNLLYDGKALTLQDNSLCDPPLYSIGVVESYICFAQTFVGTTAVHHCRQCDDKSERVCMEDGTWSGAVPQCNCPNSQSAGVDSSSFQVSLGILLAVILILVTLSVLFTIAFIILVLKRRRAKSQVNLLQARVLELSTVYEEVDPTLDNTVIPEKLETVNNRAYKTVEKTKVLELEAPEYDKVYST